MDSILNFMDDFLGDKDKTSDKYKVNMKTLKGLKQRLVNSIDEAINLDEIERLAFSKLELNHLSYYISGANGEITLHRNRQDFHKIKLYPKVLKDVSHVDLSTTVLGSKISMPILIAPSALHKLAHEDGELATARAAKEEGTAMILSTLSSTAMEKVGTANESGVRWFQLYIAKSREETIGLIREAEKSGFTALVLTVDAPILGYRDRDFQVKFSIPDGVYYENLINLSKDPKSKLNKIANNPELEKALEGTSKNNDLFQFFVSNIDPSLTWDIIPWLRSVTKLPIILKGIHRVDDALKAQQIGIDAIIVSNHGARQLDGVPSTIEMLYPISKALKKINGNKMEVYVDGGFRRGTDVFKAIALGARAVFVARPILWGLSCNGKEGVRKVLNLLKNELTIAMKLSGCPKVDEITDDYIRVKENFAKF